MRRQLQRACQPHICQLSCVLLCQQYIAGLAAKAEPDISWVACNCKPLMLSLWQQHVGSFQGFRTMCPSEDSWTQMLQPDKELLDRLKASGSLMLCDLKLGCRAALPEHKRDECTMLHACQCNVHCPEREGLTCQSGSLSCCADTLGPWPHPGLCPCPCKRIS